MDVSTLHPEPPLPPLSGMVIRRTFDDLDDLCQRGRVFSEMFPGTPASDAWCTAFAKTHPRPHGCG
jgi:hypothetical protein